MCEAPERCPIAVSWYLVALTLDALRDSSFLANFASDFKMRQAVNWWLFGVILTCLIITLLAVGLRIVGRRIRNSLQLDDWTMILTEVRANNDCFDEPRH
jgi:hypothetical protein